MAEHDAANLKIFHPQSKNSYTTIVVEQKKIFWQGTWIENFER
jgi:hypothetical protein